MSEKDNGGPAFPVVPTMEGAGQWGYAYPGMTLRDWFAGQALAGLLADSKRSRKLYENAGGDDGILRCNSEWAYSLADAMLAERSKE